MNRNELHDFENCTCSENYVCDACFEFRMQEQDQHRPCRTCDENAAKGSRYCLACQSEPAEIYP